MCRAGVTGVAHGYPRASAAFSCVLTAHCPRDVTGGLHGCDRRRAAQQSAPFPIRGLEGDER